MHLTTIEWKPDTPGKPIPGRVRMIDQSRLPEELVYLETADVREVWSAIKALRIRGAPELRAPLRELDGESDVAHQRHGCDGCKAPVKAHRQNAQHQQHFNQGGQDAVERIGHQ